MFRRLFRKQLRTFVVTTSRLKFTVSDTPTLFPRQSNEYQKPPTIYALSSGYGKCGVAVIRISGPQALTSLHKMTKSSKLEARKALLRKIYDPLTKELLDEGLCLWFPGPNSFTGEDLVEFQVHGGPAVVTSILSALSKLYFQPAAPGEFTKRAFLNGKLDLTEAEGIGDLIEAETEKQRKQASRQANGSLRKLYNSWRLTLLNALASLEAHVDFSEEHDLDSNVLQVSQSNLKRLSSDIKEHLFDGRKGEILHNGVQVAILGEPNVGKSSLLNLLSGKDAAIVTSIPGTTRDVLELVMDIGGYPMILADTAGIREDPKDEVEIEGIKRARERVKTADLLLCLISADKNYTDSFDNYLQNNKHLLELEQEDKKMLIVMNKIDLIRKEERQNLRLHNVIPISCKTHEGLRELTTRLIECFEEICGDPSEENPLISHARYRNHLSRALEYLEAYFEKTEIQDYDVAITLQDIRNAIREVGKITGNVSNEELLGVIFSKFCVGK